MPIFKFEAVDIHGAAQAGELECATRASALDSLQRRGLTPVSLQEGATNRHESFVQLRELLSWKRRQGTITAAEVVSLTESLAALTRAGLAVDRALGITANLTTGKGARTFLSTLSRSVRSGRSVAESLAATRQPLPSYFIGMVEAGEAGGSLPQTLSRLAELLRKQHDVRERIRSALTYPALLAAIVVLTVILLLTFVLPRFQALFAESDAPLPWATRAVLAVGAFVSAYWWLLLLIGMAVLGASVAWIRSAAGRERLDAWLLSTRVTFGLPAAIDTARLLRTLSALLSNGVHIGNALRIARETLSNTRLRRGLDEASRRIKAGESTSMALEAAAVFPAHAVQLARVGEETGRLEELLLEAAVILEAESAVRLERLLTFLVPALTIGMGGIIAGLIGAVLIGLLSVNELAF